MRLASAIVLCAAMVFTMCPLTAFADDGDTDGPKDNDYVKYYYDSAKPNVRTGYKKIILDPCTYTDVTNNTKQTLNVAFLEGVVKDRLIGQWAPVADTIFASEGERANYITDAEYADKFRSTSESRHYPNVKNVLSNPESQKSSLWGKEDGGWACTGICTAISLQEVRQAMGQHIIDGMNTHSQATAGKILNDSPLGKRIKFLDVEQKKDDNGNVIPEQIFYSIVSRVSREGTSDLRTCYYNSFGIVFYDFEVNPLVDENVEYFYPEYEKEEEEEEDEDDPTNEADTLGAGLTSNKDGNAVYAENNSTSENTVALSFTNTQSTEVSTSVEKSKEITFGQHLGIGINFAGETGTPATLMPFPRVSLQFDFTFEEAYRSVYQEGKTTKRETSQAVTTEAKLPPQTALEISQISENKDITVDYNTPVAITYKVAIFSLGGHNYADGVDFYQGSRDHSEYCTIFGSDYGDGGTIAVSNLYNRAVKNVNMTNYDRDYGKTYGRFRNPGGRDHSIDHVEWTKMSDEHKTEVTNEVNEILGNVPMCPCGTSMSVAGRAFTSHVNRIVPIYPLHTVKMAKGVPDEYEMNVGDKFALDGIDLEGLNENNVPYYGFDESGGHWVCCDEHGVVQTSSDKVSITPHNAATGRNILTANQEGVQYLRWVLNSDTKYTSYNDPTAAENGKFNTQIIKISITDRPFDGAVDLTGEYTGYVSDESELLSANGLKATVEDATGKEISRPVFWEAKEMNGLSVDSAGNVRFTEPGKYHVRVYVQGSQGKVYSPGWVEIEALAKKKLDKLTISDVTDPKTLATLVLGDGSDEVDLSKLKFTAEDQYGNDWLVDTDTLKWVVNGNEINGNVFKPTQAGTYEIQLRSGDVTSNKLTLKVDEARALETLEIACDKLTKDGLGVGEGYELDLADVEITAKDQYGEDWDLSGETLDWTADGIYSAVEQGKLTGKYKGNGSLKLVIGSVESNTLNYTVSKKPYVVEIIDVSDETLYEDEPFALADVKLSARDQNGDAYTFTQAELDSIEWTVTDKGTIKSDKVTYDANSRTVIVPEGAITNDDGTTGSVVLTGKFVNLNKKEVTGELTIDVKQQPILKELTLAQKDPDAVIRSEEPVRCIDFFDITGKDQYGEDFDLTNKSLTFASSNEEAYVISDAQNKEKCAITGVTPKQESNITVSATNRRGDTITSNEVTMKVPRVRTLEDVGFTDVPEMLPLGAEIDMKELGPVCYDDEGVAYTDEELEAYPAKITFSLDAGVTGAVLDVGANKLSTGNRIGEITVSASAVNKSTTKVVKDQNGNDVETGVKIWVGPKVESVAPEKAVMDGDGGKNTVTLKGKGLISGMKVIISDENGNEVQTAVTNGSQTSQQAEVTLPKEMTSDRTYTVSWQAGDTTVIPDPAVTITVKAHKLQNVEAKAATCTEDGRLEHWKCAECGKCYLDSQADHHIAADKTVVKRLGHDWGAGKVSAATSGANGMIKFICAQDASHIRTEKIPVLLSKMSAGKKSMTFTWTKVPQADGYDIFFAKCNGRETPLSCKRVKTVGKDKALKWTKKKLKKGVCYKGYVQAYRLVKGKKQYIAKSALGHSVTGNANRYYTNAKKIILKKKAITVAKGKTAVIKGAKITKCVKGRDLVSHEAKFRYATSDKAVAKVSKSGRITGVAKGKCKIYVFATNGVRAAVTVTVK